MAPPKRQLSPIEMQDLANLAMELGHDPKTRPYFAKLVAAKFPERAASFTDVATNEKIQQLENKFAQKEQLDRAREMQRQMDAQRDRLVSSGRYTKEQADEIGQIRQRHGGTIDFDQAAVLYAHENPPVDRMEGPPMDQRPGATWEFPTVSGRDGKPIPFAEFAKNPNAAAQNAAYTVISEFKKRSGIRA